MASSCLAYTTAEQVQYITVNYSWREILLTAA